MYCVAKIEPRWDFRLNEALQSPNTAGDLVYIMHGHIGTALFAPFLSLFGGRAPAVLGQTDTAWKARADVGVEGGGQAQTDSRTDTITSTCKAAWHTRVRE